MYIKYVVTSAIVLISGRLIKFHEIPWKFGKSAARGKFSTPLEIPWSAENCEPYKLVLEIGDTKTYSLTLGSKPFLQISDHLDPGQPRLVESSVRPSLAGNALQQNHSITHHLCLPL